MYGNSPKGSNTITDADDRWLLVRVESPKIKRDVLIRMEALDGITVVDKLKRQKTGRRGSGEISQASMNR